MKILMINAFYNQGGAGKIVAYLHEELQKRGHQSGVAYGRGRVTKDKYVYRISYKWEVYLEGLVTRILGIHGFTNVIGTLKFIKFINQYKPDIIHLHGLHGYYINLSILMNYINKRKISCVWTFHDDLAFTGNCGYFYKCNKWKTSCYECDKIQDYPKSNFFDFTNFMWILKKKLFTLTDNKIIVSPSEWMTNDARQSFFDKYECVTINNGIDTENVFYNRGKIKCREKHGYSITDKIVLGIAFGFSDPRKGVKHIIQMARDLKEKNVKFILIGWSRSNNNLIADLPNVNTLPFTNDQYELAEYYSMADVFVLPSLAENYATVVLESLACGTPVVGFNVGGTSEQLADGRGIVVEKGNQIKFNEAIIDLLNGNSGVKSSDDIIRDIKHNNSIHIMTTKYEELYNKVLRK